MRAASLLPVSLVLLALLPALHVPAHAQSTVRTLSDFEEPFLGTDAVVDFVVTGEEAGTSRIVVFLNAPGDPFGLVVYAANGTESYRKDGSRGIQPFPALEAGAYKVHVRGAGAFQVAPTYLDKLGGSPTVTEVNGTIQGTDAYVLAPTRGWNLHVEGDVRVEMRDLGGPTRQLITPVNESVVRGGAYVLSLRAPDGTPYRIWMEPIGPEPTPGDGVGRQPTANPTPAPGAALLLALAACLALVLRRRA